MTSTLVNSCIGHNYDPLIKLRENQNKVNGMSEMRGAKIYRYIPYQSDESFDKVESSNSRSRTAPGTILLEKQLSESEWNLANINHTKPIPGQFSVRKQSKMLPFDSPGLWSTSCQKCEDRLKMIGLAVGTHMSRDCELKRVIVLGVKEDRSIEYAVEYQNLRLEKFPSSALQKWHLEELVSSLESAIFTD